MEAWYCRIFLVFHSETVNDWFKHWSTAFTMDISAVPPVAILDAGTLEMMMSRSQPVLTPRNALLARNLILQHWKSGTSQTFGTWLRKSGNRLNPEQIHNKCQTILRKCNLQFGSLLLIWWTNIQIYSMVMHHYSCTDCPALNPTPNNKF